MASYLTIFWFHLHLFFYELSNSFYAYRTGKTMIELHRIRSRCTVLDIPDEVESPWTTDFQLCVCRIDNMEIENECEYTEYYIETREVWID